MFAQGTLAALTQESRALSAVLHDLAPEDFTRPTNCPPWDLQELVIHIADSIRVGDEPFPAAEPTAESWSAADYYRRPERQTTAYRQGNVDHTRKLARTVLAATSAARWFDEVSHRAGARLADQDLNGVVVIPGRGPMRLADWVVTRVISVAAHGLDVALTLGRAPWTTVESLVAVRPVFVSLLGVEPPAALRWDARTFLAAATGRRPLTVEEALLLGPGAERFPLLS
jgi:uncharacterized protein (TIGR03083 family)